MGVGEAVVPGFNGDRPHLPGHRLDSVGMDRVLRQTVHLEGVCGEVVELVVVEAQAYYARGLAKAFSNQFHLAIPDYDYHLNLDPKNALAYVSRGVAKARLGQFQEAIVDLNSAMELLDHTPKHDNWRTMAEKWIRWIEENNPP